MSSPLRPNFTQLPNVCLDWLLPLLTRSEMLCLLYIQRRTYGFNRASESILLSQFTDGLQRRDGGKLDRGTGLSRRTVCEALSVLERAGLIRRTRQTKPDGTDAATVYRINIDAPIPESWDQCEAFAERLVVLRKDTTALLENDVENEGEGALHRTLESAPHRTLPVRPTAPSRVHPTAPSIPISSGKKDSGKKDGKERVFDSENAPMVEDSPSEKSRPAAKRPVARPAAKKPGELSDADWLAMLQARPAYKMLDVRREYDKMLAWCESKGQQPTRQRFLSWLNRQDKPLTAPPFGSERQRRPDPVTDSILRTIQAQEEAKGNNAQPIQHNASPVREERP